MVTIQPDTGTFQDKLYIQTLQPTNAGLLPDNNNSYQDTPYKQASSDYHTIQPDTTTHQDTMQSATTTHQDTNQTDTTSQRDTAQSNYYKTPCSQTLQSTESHHRTGRHTSLRYTSESSYNTAHQGTPVNNTLCTVLPSPSSLRLLLCCCLQIKSFDDFKRRWG